jgi:hypothetical protein
MAVDDFDDLRRATYARDPIRERQENTEPGFFFQTAVDHFDITRLEDVQGKVRAGEKDDV